MAETSPHEITKLLVDWRKGNKAALDVLTPLVYQELRRIADSYIRREKPGHTLQPTALIHEAYMRMVDQSLPEWQNRAHFFGVSAQIMRQILVDHARGRQAAKRGGGVRRVPIEDAVIYSEEKAADIIALDDALQELAKLDDRKVRIIEFRYFGGLSVEDTAEALGISVATVGREMRMAQAWLMRQMSGAATGTQAAAT
jgi:RNA polymerase sigma factor (TIGR02999 family)